MSFYWEFDLNMKVAIHTNTHYCMYTECMYTVCIHYVYRVLKLRKEEHIGKAYSDELGNVSIRLNTNKIDL